MALRGGGVARGVRGLSGAGPAGRAAAPGGARRGGVPAARGLLARALASLQTGFVGLPNVGKSTLFNSLVGAGAAQAANFPFCTIEPNVGVVGVPDRRLAPLAEISASKKTVPASIEFVDIAGLVRGASQGEGMGNAFLSHIRSVDCVVQVVRCFEDDNVVHVDGRVDAVADIETIGVELVLADLAQAEKRAEKLRKGSRNPKEKDVTAVELAALERLLPALEDGRPARSVELSEEEGALVGQLQLLTAKPCIYAANVGEGDLADGGAGNPHLAALRAHAAEEGAGVVVVCAQLEAELAEMEPEEREEFLQEAGATDGSGLEVLIRQAFRGLGLRTYFTTGEQETRAWTIREGMTAPQAAGVIHTDFEKGFIKAETAAYDAFVEAQGWGGAKEKGEVRMEGKEYVVNDGDVMLFRFNV